MILKVNGEMLPRIRQIGVDKYAIHMITDISGWCKLFFQQGIVGIFIYCQPLYCVLWWFLVLLSLRHSFMLSAEGGGRMNEKDFLELLIDVRMGMHHDNFDSEYPPTEEQAAEKKKADQMHELLLRHLNKEQRELLEQWEDLANSSIARENECYYRAGFKDGMNLDRLMKKVKEEKL